MGQKIDNLALEIFELIIGAGTQSSDKLTLLQKASNKLDLLKLLVRLAKDTKSIENKNYVILETDLVEIGRMPGGWIRATKQH